MYKTLTDSRSWTIKARKKAVDFFPLDMAPRQSP
jgi:hypothetical protein